MIQIRLANVSDAESLLSIYAPYVKNTAISFEYEPPTFEEFQNRIITYGTMYPYLVAIDGEKIVGYCYASPFRTREAYKYSAEVSLYVAMDERGRGIGTMLYKELERLLALQNVRNIYACVTCSNRVFDEHLTDASLRFHSRYGFHKIGIHENCGYKFGKWYGITWFEKILNSSEATPNAFIKFVDLEK